MLVLYFKDLILKSRIKEAAGDKQIIFARSVIELSELLKDKKITRLIVDLSANSEIIEHIKPGLNENASLESIAVISHIDIKSKRLAEEAGFRMIIPRSKFVNDIEMLLDCSSQLKLSSAVEG